MPLKVCLAADTSGYPEGGGRLWAYLDWALGLRDVGCDVLWLDRPGPAEALESRLAALDIRLEFDAEAAADADLLLSLRYDLPPAVVARLKRSVLSTLTRVCSSCGCARTT